MGREAGAPSSILSISSDKGRLFEAAPLSGQGPPPTRHFPAWVFPPGRRGWAGTAQLWPLAVPAGSLAGARLVVCCLLAARLMGASAAEQGRARRGSPACSSRCAPCRPGGHAPGAPFLCPRAPRLAGNRRNPARGTARRVPHALLGPRCAGTKWHQALLVKASEHRARQSLCGVDTLRSPSSAASAGTRSAAYPDEQGMYLYWEASAPLPRALPVAIKNHRGQILPGSSSSSPSALPLPPHRFRARVHSALHTPPSPRAAGCSQ